MSEKEPMMVTVAVPVAMVEAAANQIPGSALASQFRDLLPKPKPRLVAVTPEQWYGDSLTDAEFASQPDLLTLLDEAMETVTERWTVNYTDSRSLSSDLKARIRTALGVDE